MSVSTEDGIELTGVTKRFVTPTGSTMTAIRDVNLRVGAGRFCAVVGPTGCGKSTTLTLTAGLERASAGQVRVFGKPVDGITPNAGFVFQTDALMPWKSVLDNVALGPKFRGMATRDALAEARRWLGVVGLAGFEDHYPHQSTNRACS
ncbi:ABC transporter ATP-binding protein [Acidiphilium sp. 34-64-41]|uniref:ABC transporter ATP-binding protein n=1 Tax=Acidiphilium sp. 34-64-41 TaxID=1970297 RepID=UPI00257E075E|nr:ATP-binding cassette domain-containing protein [Acidiphilium sp. 34-64-41]